MTSQVSTSPELSGSAPPALEQKPTRKRVFYVLIFLSLGSLLQGATYSHLTSFFNIYALKVKDLTSAQYGIIIGSYCCVLVFVTPLTAKLVGRKYFRDKTILFIAWTIDAIFCLLMSSTCLLSPGTMFFIGSLSVRILEATGFAMGCLMLYTITGLELDAYNHIVIPLLGGIYGLSVVAGPAVSGILYAHGGFTLPFQVLGGVLLAITCLAGCFFPEPIEKAPEEKVSENVRTWTVWKIPVLVNVLSTMSAFAVISFNESTLALRMSEQFGMDAAESGLMFLYAGGSYTIFSFLFGLISENLLDLRYLILFGQLLTLLGLALQGPLMPIETKGIIILAQVLLGVGLAPSYTCSYLQSLSEISDGRKTKEMYADLSSIHTPATSVGCTVGPLVANIIIQYFSYETAAMASFIQTSSVALLLSITMYVSRRGAGQTGRPAA